MFKYSLTRIACRAFFYMHMALLPSMAYAASQGSLDSVSTGIADISVTKTPQAQISNITDMTLPSWTLADGAVTLHSDVCIYSSTGSYTVTAKGSGAGDAFTIASGSNLLSYNVSWNGAGHGALNNTGTALSNGVASSSFGNASMTSASCNGGANNSARVIVAITQNDMEAAAASTTAYTGTLTMIVAPF